MHLTAPSQQQHEWLQGTYACVVHGKAPRRGGQEACVCRLPPLLCVEGRLLKNYPHFLSILQHDSWIRAADLVRSWAGGSWSHGQLGHIRDEVILQHGSWLRAAEMATEGAMRACCLAAGLQCQGWVTEGTTSHCSTASADRCKARLEAAVAWQLTFSTSAGYKRLRKGLQHDSWLGAASMIKGRLKAAKL